MKEATASRVTTREPGLVSAWGGFVVDAVDEVFGGVADVGGDGGLLGAFAAGAVGGGLVGVAADFGVGETGLGCFAASLVVLDGVVAHGRVSLGGLADGGGQDAEFGAVFGDGAAGDAIALLEEEFADAHVGEGVTGGGFVFDQLFDDVFDAQ